jgi:hypothetical protein
MSSTTHLKRILTQLLNISGQELGHKIIIPNDNTLILYDVPEWDDSMHAWVRHKVPGCQIDIMSMHESISGFAVVFRIDPPSNGFLSHVKNSCVLLFFCVIGFVIFSQINSLTSVQQQHMYDLSMDKSKNKYETLYRSRRNETHRDHRVHSDSTVSANSTSGQTTSANDVNSIIRRDEALYGTYSKADTRQADREADTRKHTTQDVDSSTTIASALVAPMLESLFGSLFRQAVDAWGWPIERDTKHIESSKKTPQPESTHAKWEVTDEVPEPYWVSSKRKVREF